MQANSPPFFSSQKPQQMEVLPLLPAVSLGCVTSQGRVARSDIPITALLPHSSPPECNTVSASAEAAVLSCPLL